EDFKHKAPHQALVFERGKGLVAVASVGEFLGEWATQAQLPKFETLQAQGFEILVNDIPQFGHVIPTNLDNQFRDSGAVLIKGNLQNFEGIAIGMTGMEPDARIH